MIEINIDGRVVKVEDGSTILGAARAAGIHIPTLCAYEGLSPIGACRVCVVEVEGTRKPVASCHVPAREGMVVRTDTPRLWELRKMMVDLILTTHPLDCPVCDKGGECDLQDITHEFGIKGPKYKLNNPDRTKKGATPFLSYDFQKCIQCIRCGRYSEEVEGVRAYDYHGEGGYEREIDADVARYQGNEMTGGVIAVCPVGSLLNRPFKSRSLRPWQLTKTRTTCPHCQDGCQLVLNTAKDEIHRITAVSETDFSTGLPCVKGRFGFGFVTAPSRIGRPMIKTDGALKDAQWNDAIKAASSCLMNIIESHGPASVGFIPSLSLTNEEHNAISSFIDAIGGNVYLKEGGRGSALAGVQEVLGEGYARPYDLIDDSDLILAVGADLAETNPFLSGRISRTARLKESRAVVISPRRPKTAEFAWRWLSPRPGSESSLLSWLGKKAAEISSSKGMPDWINRLDEKQLEAETGIGAVQVAEVSKAMAAAKRPCIIVSEDPTYSDNKNTGTAAANLLLLAGHGKNQGAGVFPVLNGANSWGANSAYKDRKDWKDLQVSLAEGRIKALYIAGEDGILGVSDEWNKLLRSVELLIVQDSNMTETARGADLLLPLLTFAEAEGTYTGHMGDRRDVRPGISPFGNSRSVTWTLNEVASRMGRDLRPSGPVPHEGVKDDPNPVHLQKSIQMKAQEGYPFILLTGEELYSSVARIDRMGPLFDASPEAVVRINRDDAASLKIKEGAPVKIVSRFGAVEALASIGEQVQRGTVYLPIHPHNGSQKITPVEGGPCSVRLEPA